MGPDEALHRTHSYFVIVIIVAIVMSLVPLIFFPFGMNLIEALLFMAVFQGTFRTRLDAHESYSGYGVGWVVNSTLRLNIIGNAGGQVLGGLFVRNIIKCWFTLVVLSMVVIVVGTLFAWVMSIDFPRVLAVPIVAILLACFCEGCYWVVAGRQRYWYLPKSLLRERLKKLNTFSQSEIEEVVRMATEKELLHVGI